MHFRILGPLEVKGKKYSLTPQAPKLRSVLAALLLNYNKSVYTDSLIDELWNANPPASCHTTLQTYIYQLRKIFAVETARSGPLASIVTRPAGYAIELDPTDFDLHVFTQLAERGNFALESGDPQLAAERLRQALELWRDVALADVQRGLLLQAHSARLEEERLRTLESRIEADLQLARHRRLASELRSLTIQHPLHEGFHAKLMLSLYRSHRRHEALQTYQRLRETLDRELGIDPNAELQRLQHAILNADRSLDAAPPRESIEVTAVPAVPAQLPRDIGDFTGRDEELAALETLFGGDTPDDATAVPIALVTGAIGSGKTAFLVHAGHRLRSRYPDGQFFVDMRGSRLQPAEPARVLEEMLRALGIRPQDVPGTLDERSRLFRSLVSDRRMLIVLDDVASAAQVCPLLPGSPRGAVLIGSRLPMPELPGARSVELGELPCDAALSLLAASVGDDRVTADPVSAAALVRLFGRLPLALRAVGTRLRAAPAESPAALVAKLGDHPWPLSELRVRHYDVRTELDEACRQLDEQHRAALRWLALREERTFDAHSAVRYLRTRDARADLWLLGGLHDAGLLQLAHRHDEAGSRYRLPELVRLYAQDRQSRAAPAEEVPQQREASQSPSFRPASEVPWIAARHDSP
jgi:DNA-binding SARP family transcriptional activator